MLAEDGADVLAFTGFPGAHWKQVWSNNPQELAVSNLPFQSTFDVRLQGEACEDTTNDFVPTPWCRLNFYP